MADATRSRNDPQHRRDPKPGASPAPRVTAWEIAIKQSLGKLDLARPAALWLPDVLKRTGFEVAELGLSAALLVRALPWHHRDPFDRLLIAQALDQGFTIVSRDGAFGANGVPSSARDAISDPHLARTA